MNGTNPCARDVQPVLACLGVASRFRLVRALAGADRCVGELADAVGLSQSCTTRHLQALERVGLVKGRREGRRVRFSLRVEAQGLGGLLGWALSGSAPDGVVAGPQPGTDRAPAPPAGSSSGRAGERTSRRVGRTRGPAPHREAADDPMAGAGPMGSAGSREIEAPDPESAVGPRPARRTGDLEDYLL